MQIKTLSYNFSKFYANIIYELLKNLTNLCKLNLSVKKPILYKLYANSYVSYISIVRGPVLCIPENYNYATLIMNYCNFTGIILNF
jgi:hypothetical protein